MRKLVWLLPMLAAAVPVLNLAAYNVDQIQTAQIGVPLLLAVGGATLLFAVFWLMRRELLRSAIATTVVVAIFFGYGRFYEWVWARRIFSSMLLLNILLGLLALALAIWSVRSILRTERRLEAVGQFLSAVALLLVAFSTIALINGRRGNTTPAAASGAAAAVHPPPILEERAALPDIYYIILDGYARADILDTIYGFDNSPFLDALRQRGFYVADESFSNYSMSYLSIASSLKMDYVDEEIRTTIESHGPKTTNRDLFYALIRSPPIAERLKAEGYRYVTTLTNWGGTERSDSADVIYRYSSFLGGEFNAVLLRTTLLRSFAPSVAAMHRFTFARMRDIPKLAGPTFAFVHCLLPHNPYVFDRHGNERANIPLTLQWKEKTGSWHNRQGYVEQVIFLNDTLLSIIDEILANSQTDPVIILQGDHGSAATKHKNPAGRRPEAWERMAILNALHVSDAMKAELSPAISPVNTFRLLLATYFDTDDELLPDESYFGWYNHSYERLQNVTDQLEVGEAPWLK